MLDPELALAIDTTSSVPPFEQLRTRIAALVAEGQLSRGTKLPTVRQLALDLGLAANTVARSYRELEADGVVVTQGRRGTFVHSDSLNDQTPAELSRQAADFATAARRAGLSAAEAAQLVEQAWRAG
jgi:DNA-binding transcriptional regulator YhcF (GntR family)